MGTSFANMDLAEDRGRFSKLLQELEIPYPEYGAAINVPDAIEIAKRIGYPVLIRPSYVLGGQGMRIAVKEDEFIRYINRVLATFPENEFLVDKYLEHAVEVDVDSVYDGEQLHIGGIMQHIEPAGVHSGDSTAVLPPYSLSDAVIAKIEDYQLRIAKAMNIQGFLNVQYA
ncbi:carbamoyl phosphate synthase large subunit, partial [Arthrospira platensis SPKY1]|nr:carbamoyl phosphate synthase large subunit [Arthrospira platensis SPKY1]